MEGAHLNMTKPATLTQMLEPNQKPKASRCAKLARLVGSTAVVPAVASTAAADKPNLTCSQTSLLHGHVAYKGRVSCCKH